MVVRKVEVGGKKKKKWERETKTKNVNSAHTIVIPDCSGRDSLSEKRV